MPTKKVICVSDNGVQEPNKLITKEIEKAMPGKNLVNNNTI